MKIIYELFTSLERSINYIQVLPETFPQLTKLNMSYFIYQILESTKLRFHFNSVKFRLFI